MTSSSGLYLNHICKDSYSKYGHSQRHTYLWGKHKSSHTSNFLLGSSRPLGRGLSLSPPPWPAPPRVFSRVLGRDVGEGGRMWSPGSATQEHRHLSVTMPTRAMVTGYHSAYIGALFLKDGKGHSCRDSCRDSRSPRGRNPSGLRLSPGNVSSNPHSGTF